MDDKTVIRFPNDNTVIRPRPGGKRQAMSAAPSRSVSNDATRINFNNHTSAAASSAVDVMADYRPMPDNKQSLSYSSGVSGENALVNCASTLISLMIKLSASVMQNDVAQLKHKLKDEIKQFEINAARAEISNDTILQARYVICTSLDETVASTPWGQESNWSQQSLLSLFHGETWGGEKFFLLLERLLKEPAKNLNILELMYICISLGFQGKYRVLDNGYAQVEHLREDLFRQLRSLRHDFNKELSSHWRGVTDPRSALIRYVPLWVVGALSSVVLLAMFSSFTYMLDQSSTPVIQTIIELGPEDSESVLSPPEPDTSPAKERLVRPPQRIVSFEDRFKQSAITGLMI